MRTMPKKDILPSAALQRYIRYFWMLEEDKVCNEAKTFKIIADGCPGLIFQENPNSFLDSGKRKLPQLFIHGLTSSSSQKTTYGEYNNIGVYFQPDAIKSIFGIDAYALTDSYIDLNDVIKNNLAEQLLNEAETTKRVAILADFIAQRIINNKYPENPKVSYAIAKLNIEKEDSLHKIQSALNLSARSLERLFKRNVGVSPKLFYRICRFQAALATVRSLNFKAFTQVAYQHAYADQSHFIREFKEFVGATPTQFLSRADEQLLNFPEWKSY